VSVTHVFAGNPLDRADALRRDPEWLQAAATDTTSRYLPLWQLNVLVEAADGQSPSKPADGQSPSKSADGLHLRWLGYADIERLDIAAPPIFLGLDAGVAHFAIDISELPDPTFELNLPERISFEESRAAGMGLASGAETGILAQARAQVGWHKSHRFCSACGNETSMEKGGHQRSCARCNAQHFPRTDPVAIMVIEHQDRCLLGQSHGPLVQIGMFSALAGFVDQGESIEEAVRREIREEAGVSVGEVRYHSSQPWPFPSSLMIGCHGKALSTEITIDAEEMHDVRWFERGEVKAALAGTHDTLRLPGPIAIAHHLIRAWAEGEVF
jgi:NAD+ diphosphatase